jgi:hypothetical protein
MFELQHHYDPYDDKIRLSWNDPSQSLNPHYYRLFRRKISSSLRTNPVTEDFQSISTFDKDNANENISVLNIHPNCGSDVTYTDYLGAERTIKQSESLSRWINEATPESPNGFGKGKITVYSMAISTFNLDPIGALRDVSGAAKYDVVCFGFYDSAGASNTSEIINTPGTQAIKDYILEGYGVIAGHDFISGVLGSNKGLATIRDLFKIKVGQWGVNNTGYDYDFKSAYWGSQLKIEKPSSLMYYPWNIGTLDDILDITYTHTTSNLAEGDIWLSIIPTTKEGEQYLTEEQKLQAASYLSTYNSTALIQIGHKLDIKDIEKKILVNTIVNLKQLTDKNSFTDTGIDDEKSLRPTIVNHYLELDNYSATFEYRTEDVGTLYQYYVERTDMYTKEITRSNIIETVYKSGLNRYMYNLSQIASDTPETDEVIETSWVSTEDRLIVTQPLKKGYYAFKIVAVDNNLNVSPEKEVVFFMPGIVNSEKSLAITKYPNAQRVNHRYRGPHESRKANDVYAQIRFNLDNIRKIVEQLDKEKDVMLKRADVSCVQSLEYGSAIKNIDRAVRKKRGEIYG